MTLSFDGAVADAGDHEPTVILVGKNGIALQWLDPDPEDVRSGEETVRGEPMGVREGEVAVVKNLSRPSLKS